MANQVATVEEVLNTIGAAEVPVIMVFNKADASYSRTILASYRRRYPQAVTISALTGDGLPELKTAIEAVIATRSHKVQVRFPASDGALNAYIRSKVPVLEERWTATRATLVIESDTELVEVLKGRGAVVTDLPAG